MNVRDIRTSFLEKQTLYACSMEGQLTLDLENVARIAEGIRLTLRQQPQQQAQVFHVRELKRVPGPDGKNHDVPLGTIASHEQSLILTGLPQGNGIEPMVTSGTLEGRLTIQPAKPSALIDVHYRGVVQFVAHPSAVVARGEARESVPIEGKAFLATAFDTLQPKYHWLTEHVSIAFGTWRAEPAAEARRIVRQDYDLYTAG